MKKVKVRTPTGKNRIVYRREPTKGASCANCGTKLHGVAKGSESRIRKLSLSDKRPLRPFGGYYCSPCSQEVFRNRARNI